MRFQTMMEDAGSRAWLKMALLTAALFVVYLVVDLFVVRPSHWLMLLAALFPLLAVVVVIVPLQAERRKN